MAGPKKKKKPAANPARGFATTSVASKPRVEQAELEDSASTASVSKTGAATPLASAQAPSGSAAGPGQAGAQASTAPGQNPELTPEEFERQLEVAELQILVEKHGPKVKRDAQRQKARLETDRRIQRSSADSINCPKWLPPEIMDHILDLIKAESRFASVGVSSEASAASSSGKMPPEEDLTVKLWTLQHALISAGISPNRTREAIVYVLDMSPSIPSNPRDSLWGLEEALDWLARECSPEELPSYEPRGRPAPKPIGKPKRKWPCSATACWALLGLVWLTRGEVKTICKTASPLRSPPPKAMAQPRPRSRGLPKRSRLFFVTVILNLMI